MVIKTRSTFAVPTLIARAGGLGLAVASRMSSIFPQSHVATSPPSEPGPPHINKLAPLPAAATVATAATATARIPQPTAAGA